MALALLAACSQTPRVHLDPESGRADVDMEAAGESWEEWRPWRIPAAA